MKPLFDGQGNLASVLCSSSHEAEEFMEQNGEDVTIVLPEETKEPDNGVILRLGGMS